MLRRLLHVAQFLLTSMAARARRVHKTPATDLFIVGAWLGQAGLKRANGLVEYGTIIKHRRHGVAKRDAERDDGKYDEQLHLWKP